VEGKGADPLAQVRDLAARIAAGDPVALTLAAIERRYPDA